jgi:hypothetical protein
MASSCVVPLLIQLPWCEAQTRGNQRETDRQRAAKRNEKGKKEEKRAAEGLTPLQRKER